MAKKKSQKAKTINPVEAGKKGGKARAEGLTSARRSEIARTAANARWGTEGKSDLMRATHGSEDHPLRIGDIEIPCYVLEGGTRVIAHRGLQRTLGMAESGGAQRTLAFLGRIDAKGIDTKDLALRIASPIRFLPPAGGVTHGYEATLLADMCDVVLEARSAGVLDRQQIHIAEQCEILVRSFAKVGIIALVDEATGYQFDRARTALEELLEEFLSAELRAWVKTFPDAYFRQLCRLKNVPFRGDMRFPKYFGRMTANIVYKRLAPGVLQELQARSPANEKGNRKNKLFQWLSADVGHPKLLQHMGAVVALMKISADYETFKQRLDEVAPIQDEKDLAQFKLPFDDAD